MKITVPTMGRIVHYVRDDGTQCPAIVTWGDTDDGKLHLCLFGPISFIPNPSTEIVRFVPYHPPLPDLDKEPPYPPKVSGVDYKPNTWHWPEREGEREVEINVEENAS